MAATYGIAAVSLTMPNLDRALACTWSRTLAFIRARHTREWDGRPFAKDPPAWQPQPPSHVVTPRLVAAAATADLRHVAMQEGTDHVLRDWSVGCDFDEVTHMIAVFAIDPLGRRRTIPSLLSF